MLDLLWRLGLLPPDFPRSASDVPELTGELHNAVIGFLAERFGTSDWGRLFMMGSATLGTFLTTFAVTINNHIAALRHLHVHRTTTQHAGADEGIAFHRESPP